jgi:hypothetical protein
VVLSTGSFMIFFALHFTQYASIAMSNLNSLFREGRSPQPTARERAFQRRLLYMTLCGDKGKR